MNQNKTQQGYEEEIKKIDAALVENALQQKLLDAIADLVANAINIQDENARLKAQLSEVFTLDEVKKAVDNLVLLSIESRDTLSKALLGNLKSKKEGKV